MRIGQESSAATAARQRALRIVLAEDDELLARVYATMLERHGHEVHLVARGEDGLREPPFDALVADLHLEGEMSGLDLVEALRERGSDAPAILISGLLDPHDCARACRLGVTDVLEKPFELARLAAAVERACPPGPPQRYERTYLPTPASRERAARDLVAFLVDHGVGPAHRARMATALALLVDKTEHRFAVRTAVAEGSVTLAIDSVAIGALLDVEHSRVGALAERVELLPNESGEPACVVHARFDVTPVLFEPSSDLSEHDFLDVETLNTVLGSILLKRDVEVPPTLAVTVGRLLSSLSRNPSGFEAVWS